jgi:nucleotide-binding universal stress UspA family protein
MYKRILLPLDGSALAEQALPYAIAQAERFGAELILLRVFEPIAPKNALVPREAARRAEERTKAWTQEYLERVAARVQEHGIPVQVVTVEGHPRTEIVQFAESNQVDLIVISTRGQSGFSRWLMGSTADRVMRGASVPVLLVRAAKAKA